MDTPNTKPAPLPGYVLEAVLDVWGQAGEQHLIPITGRSMLPLIGDGDHVLVAHGCAGVRRGDVVVFRHQGRLIAHRVLCIYGGNAGPAFVTKGDNASQLDSPLSADEIVGRVLTVKRGNRYMSLDTTVWRIVGWLFAVSTLAWTKLYSRSRDLKQRLLGPQPNRLTAFLRRCALASFLLALKTVQAVLCRWEEDHAQTSAKCLAKKSVATTSVVPKAAATPNTVRVGSKTPAASPRPEAELLLCCARTCMDSASAERIKALLREDIDWAYLTQTALRHRVMPLLYQSLSSTCPEAVPGVTMDELRDYFYINAWYNLFLTQELLNLLDLLKAFGISAIPFKGPVLAASAYGDLVLRMFGDDLDILVHQRDVLRAKDLLISQGYRLRIQPETQARCAYPFVHDDKRVIVDLHWGMTTRCLSFPLDPERLWDRLEPVSLAGTTVLNLSPEDLLLILCMHGAKPLHCWKQLQWICDVAELLRVHQGLDWEQVIEQANNLGSERMLFLGLFLASDLLGAALPEEVWQRIQAEPVVKALAAQVREGLSHEVDSPSTVLARDLFYLRTRERLQDRVLYCLHRATPNSGDRALLPLPPFLSFLYYLLRPIRLVGKYGPSLLKQRLA